MRFECGVCHQDAEGERVWLGEGGSRIHDECSMKLSRAFGKFLGINPTSDEYGVTVHWHEIANLIPPEDEELGPVARFFSDRQAYTLGISIEDYAAQMLGEFAAAGLAEYTVEYQRDPAIRGWVLFAYRKFARPRELMMSLTNGT